MSRAADELYALWMQAAAADYGVAKAGGQSSAVADMICGRAARKSRTDKKVDKLLPKITALVMDGHRNCRPLGTPKLVPLEPRMRGVNGYDHLKGARNGQAESS